MTERDAGSLLMSKREKEKTTTFQCWENVIKASVLLVECCVSDLPVPCRAENITVLIRNCLCAVS